MTDHFSPPPLLSAFLAASLLLAVTPGPGVFYIVARSLAQGRRSGLISVAGVALGNLGSAFAASLGLAALFAISSAAFTLVKYAGAIYLVWLGVRMVRASRAREPATVRREAPARHIFRDGIIVALLNPKTMLFFAAFLPQFLGPEGRSPAHTMALGGLFVAIAAITDSAYALAAGTVSRALARGGRADRLGRMFGGATLIGLGILGVFHGSRHCR